MLVDTRDRQTARVCQHGMEVGGTDLNRASGLECIQRRFVGIAVEPGHAHAVPAAHFKPDIRALALVGIQTRLNGFLENLASHRLVFQVAQRHGATTVPRMHVRIDEAGHQHAPRQIDQLCLRADVRGNAFIATDIDNLPASDGDRLLHGVLAIDGIDIAVAHHHVSRCRTLCLTPHQRHAGKCRCRRNGDKQPGKFQLPHLYFYSFGSGPNRRPQASDMQAYPIGRRRRMDLYK